MFELAEQYKKEVLSPLLPYIINTSEGYDNFHKKEVNFHFWGDTLIFKDSIFDAGLTEDSRLIHFTSIKKCISILESNQLWFSRFDSFLDKSEFEFADKYFCDKSTISSDYIKKHLYCLSTCNYDSTTIKDKHMWQHYGDGSKGVCMVLKINQNSFSNDLHIGKIQYAIDPVEELVNLKRRHDSFVKEAQINYANLSETVYFVSSFYKKVDYEKENEIRILKYIDWIDDDSPPNYKFELGMSDTNGISIKVDHIIYGDDVAPENKVAINQLFNKYISGGN